MTTAASALTLRRELTRKVLHLASATLPIAWGTGVIEAETLFRLLLVALALAIAIEGARHLAPGFGTRFQAWFGPLLRKHEVEGLTGATWLAGAMLGALALLPAGPALIALWAVSVGDGSAAIAGRLATAHRPETAGRKSVVGSLMCCAATAAGVLWFSDLDVVRALAVGAIVALAEFPRGPLDDNVRVTVAAGLAAWGLGVA